MAVWQKSHGKGEKDRRWVWEEVADLPQELIRTENVGIEQVKHNPGLRPPEAVLQLLGSEHESLVPLWADLLLDGLGGLHTFTACYFLIHGQSAIA